MKKNIKMNMHQIIWYLLIFSIIGLIIETVYCFVTTGVLESRKGLILGPVCPIYGVGAVVAIVFLSRFKGQKLKLFIYGGILGSCVEYIISFAMECIYSTRFWDYSYMQYHLNGRISLVYTLFWAVLAVLMIEFVEPILDKLINKIKIKWIDIAILTIFVIDALLTIWGINVYMQRVVEKKSYKKSSNKAIETIYWVEDNCFSNEIMSKIFPNLRTINSNGDEIWVRDLIEK